MLETTIKRAGEQLVDILSTSHESCQLFAKVQIAQNCDTTLKLLLR